MLWWLLGLLLMVGAILMIVFGSLAVKNNGWGALNRTGGIVLIVIGVVLLIASLPPIIIPR